jgi:hypothetical protein
MKCRPIQNSRQIISGIASQPVFCQLAQCHSFLPHIATVHNQSFSIWAWSFGPVTSLILFKSQKPVFQNIAMHPALAYAGKEN